MNEMNFFKVKDKYSALTHLIGFLLSLIATPILLIRAASHQVSMRILVTLAIFMATMVLLYGASTTYHSFHLERKKELILKRIDHISIFYLIAGSYTPLCLGVFYPETRHLGISIWLLAIVGTVFKMFWVTCPKWVSSILYLGMGWISVLLIPMIRNQFGRMAFFWLLLGGIFYSIGAYLYALKKPLGTKEFGNHEIFHVLVMLGSLCHYLLMFYFVA
ncbi:MULTISPECIES: hemolysin III family protein [Terrabacteria group]|uniref:PAQR family membrane homeostasis protein TrhA n=1 Tax=Bacillati TaxID=1783272 RepID=UPI0019392981|nr:MULTISPECIES: hemolysin III family protein [Terrabacteria group]MBW9212064.1 hemolysin III family protein [Trueperella sp. zg.1013]QRG87130.1 hemolysin III family protein [Bulleidia sp. zg-1006]